jgi:predicted TIM-barrel fold metal-dependent hydrolase
VTTYDLHQHLWPESLVEALARRTSPPMLRGNTLVVPGEGAFEIDPSAYGTTACIASLDRAGIDVAVVSCPPTLGIDELDEEEAETLRDAYHEGALAAVDTSDGRLLALSMGRAKEGFVGAIVGADELRDLDEVAPALDELERRGAFVMVHPGTARPPADAPAWWAATVDYTAQMQRAYATWLAHGAERWPELRIVFSILAGGAPFQLERMQARGYDPRNSLRPTIYLEASSYGRRALELCLSTFGARQIVYGSDSPVIDGGLTLEHVRSFGPAAVNALCHENPTVLLT